MRLSCLLFTAMLVAAPVRAEQTSASSTEDSAANPEFNLPVSIERIKEALEQPTALTFHTLDERPTFRVQILERQRIEELLATLNFKAGPTPAGGVYWDEIQRQMFPAVDNPLRQPYAAFGQGELLTLLVEKIATGFLGGKALNAVSTAQRDHAESAAKEEVRKAVQQYCAAQPNGGAGIQICSLSPAIR